ncbi:MAG: hypothetical protein ABSF09_09170 [Candidatus Bathyarchaeia archaeon]|jgi:hypothetical protein
MKSKLYRFAKGAGILAQNLFCLAIWVWLVCRIIGTPFPFADIIQEFYSNTITPNITLWLRISIAAILLALLVFRKVKTSLKITLFFLLRLIFFPVVALFHFIALPIRTYRLVTKGVRPVVDNIIRTTLTRSAIIIVLLLPVSIFIVSNSADSLWLVISLFLLALTVLLVQRIGFLWTAKPLIVMEEFTAIFSRVMEAWIKLTLFNTDKNVDAAKQYEKAKPAFQLAYKSYDWLIGFAKRYTDRRIVLKFFFFLFVLCFALTVFSFAAVLSAVTKLDPSAFSNMTASTFFDYVYLSLLIITTSAQVVAVSPLAKIVVSMEIVSGIALLTLLVFQFSIISIPEVAEKRDQLLDTIESKRADLKKRELPLINALPEAEHQAE